MFSSIGRLVWDMTLIGSVTALIVLFLRLALKRFLPRRTMIVLWVFVLFRFCMPFSISSPVSIFNSFAPTDSSILSGGFSISGYSQSIEIENTPPASLLPEPQIETAENIDWYQVLGAVYLLSAGAMLTCLFAIYRITAKRFRSARPMNPEIRDAAFPQKCRIPVYLSAKTDSPVLFGILHPKIILPDTPEVSDPEKLIYILTHELSHLRRHDNLKKLIASLILCMHWFNPLLWICYLLMQRDIEYACDESVIKSLGEARRISYAQTLLDFSGKASFPLISLTAFGENNTKRRISHILKFRKSTVISIAAAAVVIIVAGVLLITNPFKKASPDSSSDGSSLSSSENGSASGTDLPSLSGSDSTSPAGSEISSEAFSGSGNSTLPAKDVFSPYITDNKYLFYFLGVHPSNINKMIITLVNEKITYELTDKAKINPVLDATKGVTVTPDPASEELLGKGKLTAKNLYTVQIISNNSSSLIEIKPDNLIVYEKRCFRIKGGYSESLLKSLKKTIE